MCQCKTTVHERCWNSWTRHTGAPVCLICRLPAGVQPVVEEEPEPEPEQQAVWRRRCPPDVMPWISTILFVLMLIIAHQTPCCRHRYEL